MKSKYLLFAIVLISCEKQPSFTIGEQFLVIEENNNYEITEYDTLLEGGYYDPKVLDIDLDKDDIPDFKISAGTVGSPGLGYYSSVTIKSLHDSACIHITEFSDTLYIHTEYDTSYDGNFIYIDISEIKDCQKNDPGAAIFSIRTIKNASCFYQGDTIQNNFSWHGDILLSSRSDFNSWFDNEPRGDTTFYNYYYTYDDCHMFPQQSAVYIAVKTMQGGNTYLGWIKLNVINNATIVIFETAVFELGKY